MPLNPNDFPDQGGSSAATLDPSGFPDQPSDTKETDKALKETDSLGVRGGPAQGPLGRFFGLRDPFVGPDGKIKPDVEAKMAADQAAMKDKGFSPMMGDVAESATRMMTLPVSVGIQGLPPDHPVRQAAEGYYGAVHGIARSLSEEDNLALMAATAGLAGPGASAASKVGSRALSALFATQIASDMPEQWKAFKAAPDLKTKTAIAGQILGSAAFTLMAGKHAAFGDRPIFGGRVKPPLAPDVTIPTDPAAQMEMLKAGLARGDLTKDQFNDLAQRVQGQQPQPAAQQAPAPGGVVSETARVTPQAAPEAATEAAPVEAGAETPEQASARYNDVRDRFGIYGIPHEPIVDAAVAEGEQLTHAEAADALEAHEKTIPSSMRRLSMAQGKTISQINMEAEWTEFIHRKLREQEQALEKERGISILSKQPNVALSVLPEGGWKVTVGPTEQYLQFPPAPGVKGATATFQKRTVPEAELYLSPKGELIPYANKPNAPPDAVPDVQRKPTVPPAKGSTEAGGPRDAPPKGPGTQPVTTAQRPVAPKAAPPKAEEGPRYVVEDLFDPSTRKQKGSIVKDQTTGKVVAKFETSSMHPDAADLLDTKAKAEEHIKKLLEKTAEGAATSDEKEPVIVGGKKKGFKVGTFIFDEYGNSPETPVATAVSEMGGIKSKSAAIAQGKYEGNQALWDDPIKFSHLTHQKIYDPDGEMPDVMAQNLYDAGLIHEPTVDAMRVALEKESAGIRSKVKNAPEKQAGVKEQIKQSENFGKGQRSERESKGEIIAVDSLSIGDKVNVDGTDLKVTDVDPDGIVTLEDGKRYGVQKVSDGEVIFGQVETPKEAVSDKPAAAPKEETDMRNVGQHGQKALNTAATNPVAARKAAFVREGDHHVHRDTGLIIRHNKDKGLFEVVDPASGEVIDTGPTRRATIDKHLDGLARKAAPDPVPTTAEGEPEYDFGTMEGFGEFLEDRFGRKMTDKERKLFEPIIQKIADARTDASEAGSVAFGKLLQHFHDVKDIPFDEAVKRIKDAIEDATGPCT